MHRGHKTRLDLQTRSWTSRCTLRRCPSSLCSAISTQFNRAGALSRKRDAMSTGCGCPWWSGCRPSCVISLRRLADRSFDLFPQCSAPNGTRSTWRKPVSASLAAMLPPTDDIGHGSTPLAMLCHRLRSLTLRLLAGFVPPSLERCVSAPTEKPTDVPAKLQRLRNAGYITPQELSLCRPS